jgi:hypothetical protein
MASSKRQTTAAKRDREQAVRDKRARKEEKKQAVKEAKAAGIPLYQDIDDDRPVEDMPVEVADVEQPRQDA